MTFIDLFCGAGGATLGMVRSGWEHLLGVDCDEHAVATYQAAGFHGHAGRVEDCDGPQVDAVWASPPCQPHSSAGKRQGAQDDRDGYPALWKALDAIRPTWLLSEQVRGILWHKGDCDRGSWEPGKPCSACYWHGSIIPQLRARFAWVGWRVYDAADLGVPQHRRRVLLVAGPHQIRWPAPTHCDPMHSLLIASGARRPWVTAGEALGLSPIIDAGTNPHSKGAEHERRYRDVTNEPSPAMAAEQVGNRGPWVWPAPAPAVVANEGKGATCEKGDRRYPQRASDGALHHLGKRRLSVREAAALQAFPPDYPWQGTKTAQYRAVGNSVPPPMSEALGRAVLEAIREEAA